jgi:hypothetical protein
MGAFDAVAGIVIVKDGELRERLVEHRFTDRDTDGGQPARRGMGIAPEPLASGLVEPDQYGPDDQEKHCNERRPHREVAAIGAHVAAVPGILHLNLFQANSA